MSQNQLSVSHDHQPKQAELEIAEVLQFSDARLREQCASLEKSEFGAPQLYRWIERLNRTRHASRGIGIAGPHIGLMQRLIVIDIPAKDWIVFGPVDPVPMHAPGRQLSSRRLGRRNIGIHGAFLSGDK